MGWREIRETGFRHDTGIKHTHTLKSNNTNHTGPTFSRSRAPMALLIIQLILVLFPFVLLYLIHQFLVCYSENCLFMTIGNVGWISISEKNVMYDHCHTICSMSSWDSSDHPGSTRPTDKMTSCIPWWDSLLRTIGLMWGLWCKHFFEKFELIW